MSFPRVSTILREMVLFAENTDFLQPKYLRRGRLVDWAASQIAQNKPIPDSWWDEHSGERDDDRVEHREVLPYIDSVRQFLAERRFIIEACQLEVTNPVERYVGHLDWQGHFLEAADYPEPWRWWIIDLKCGEPPPEWVTIKTLENGVEYQVKRRNPLFDAYRLQTAAYAMGLACSHKIVAARRASLHLFDGTYKLVLHENARDMATFQILARAFHLQSQWRAAA